MSRAATTGHAGWWLQPGAARCGFCAILYREEAAYFCADCDRPVCPLCIIEIRVSREVLCPGCEEERPS